MMNPRVDVAASTCIGVAAALIDEQTLYTLLKLDCQEGGKTKTSQCQEETPDAQVLS